MALIVLCLGWSKWDIERFETILRRAKDEGEMWLILIMLENRKQKVGSSMGDVESKITTLRRLGE